MADLDIKTGQTYRLHAQYQDGKLRFGLQSIAGGLDYGMYDDMWLTAEEWDRLTKWVEFQRADERTRQHEAKPFLVA